MEDTERTSSLLLPKRLRNGNACRDYEETRFIFDLRKEERRWSHYGNQKTPDFGLKKKKEYVKKRERFRRLMNENDVRCDRDLCYLSTSISWC